MARRPEPRALPDTSRLLAEALGLQPPTSAEPGYWKTADSFVSVNAGMMRDGPVPGDRLRALISFDPADLHQTTKDRVREKIPEVEKFTKEERRAQWGMILRLGKEARTERVGQILGALANLGIVFDYESIVVHRVSNTFFASIDVDTLARLITVRASGFAELRRIVVSGVAR